MKKFIAGFVAGALIFGGVSAYAATGLLGAKVTSVYTLQDKSGKKIADAAVINGSAYAPVRAVSQATKASLTVNGKVITVSEAENSLGPMDPKLLADLRLYKEKLTIAEDGDLPSLENSLATELAKSEDKRIPGRVEGLNQKIADLKAQIADLKTKIADLEKQLGITQ